jgi:ATP-dependent helicase/nuclease subunit B
MLQAFRLTTANPTADYEAMHEALAVRASAVPRSGGRLDDADVWLGALAQGKVLLRGTDVVREAFPNLDAGLSAAERRQALPFTSYHGRLEARPKLDPRNNPDIVLSARRLETLGTCPLRYLIRYGLHVTAPEASEWAADRWLTPLQRGRVLHDVYERALREARARGHEVTGPGFEAIAVAALESVLQRERETSPPPGDAVYAVESEVLREDVLAFVQMTRSMGAPWEHLEQRFGRGTVGEGPVRITLESGAILVSGAIDRIDRTDEGFVVIDYKTGSAASFGRPQAVFHGGRRLQHAIYSAVTRRLLGDVIRAEYHFPTHRGETRVSEFHERDLRRARRIIDALLDLVASGHFHPTDDSDDCRFCDYRRVCRVRDETGRTNSPMAEWAGKTDAP